MRQLMKDAAQKVGIFLQIPNVDANIAVRVMKAGGSFTTTPHA
jgi:hypothetical protein